ncbi:WAT1-related protein At1g25270-like [Olea europaea var. sylvestris]|uniref:WAT1-related protein At1g25270-like n=1 Tax=Olea europaea var. sylvestris TaxID=158386 RepID=UPI000C1D4F8E|nr:WAT1-related protein At1g25270-like [Olea europaea var. sylvestris]
MKICDSLQGLEPTLVMLMVQTIFAGVNIVYKLAANDGMKLSILVGYRFMFGAAFMVPVALLVERKKRPKLTWMVVFQAFLCGLFGGSLGQNLYLKSMALTSATFASALTNLIPAITFVIAVILRLEKLGLSTLAGVAKVIGTLTGIGGAMVLTFYKGLDINIWNTNINLLETTSKHHAMSPIQSYHSGTDVIYGALLSLASCVCYSLWLIIQAKAAQRYPCPYSFTAMMTLWASIQGTGFALCTERDWSQWKLGLDIRLLTVFIAGVLGSGVMFTLIAWCIRIRGPLFVSVFNPLMLLLVAIAGSLFLEEKLHLGTIIGAALIVIGLYCVLWGKGKESKKVVQLVPENDDQSGQVEIEIPSSTRDNHSRGRKEAAENEEEEKRDPRGSSRVLGGLYWLKRSLRLERTSVNEEIVFMY